MSRRATLLTAGRQRFLAGIQVRLLTLEDGAGYGLTVKGNQPTVPENRERRVATAPVTSCWPSPNRIWEFARPLVKEITN
jgi:hypothetical protein